jgi:hypothetical protein
MSKQPSSAPGLGHSSPTKQWWMILKTMEPICSCVARPVSIGHLLTALHAPQNATWWYTYPLPAVRDPVPATLWRLAILDRRPHHHTGQRLPLPIAHQFSKMPRPLGLPHAQLRYFIETRSWVCSASVPRPGSASPGTPSSAGTTRLVRPTCTWSSTMLASPSCPGSRSLISPPPLSAVPPAASPTTGKPSTVTARHWSKRSSRPTAFRAPPTAQPTGSASESFRAVASSAAQAIRAPGEARSRLSVRA